jgi:hypothetical protein
MRIILLAIVLSAHGVAFTDEIDHQTKVLGMFFLLVLAAFVALKSYSNKKCL